MTVLDPVSPAIPSVRSKLLVCESTYAFVAASCALVGSVTLVILLLPMLRSAVCVPRLVIFPCAAVVIVPPMFVAVTVVAFTVSMYACAHSVPLAPKSYALSLAGSKSLSVVTTPVPFGTNAMLLLVAIFSMLLPPILMLPNSGADTVLIVSVSVPCVMVKLSPWSMVLN